MAADHAYALQQADRSAAHQMPEGEESLYAELRLTGGTAWNKLHGDVTSRLTGVLDGRTLPDHGHPRPGHRCRRRGAGSGRFAPS